MSLSIDFWQLIGLLISGLGAVFGVVWGVVKVALTQAQRHQDTSHAQLIQRLETIEKANQTEAGQWHRIEREILQLKSELPLNYVRREDYVQAVATIMAKLDAMSLRFENILLKGVRGND